MNQPKAIDSAVLWQQKGFWKAVQKRSVVSLILGTCIFLSAFEYLFSVSIAGTEVRVFQLLLLLCIPLIFTCKRSVAFFFFANLVLLVGAVYSGSKGYFESTANLVKVCVHQEMTIVTVCLFLSFNYHKVDVTFLLKSNFYAVLIGSVFGLVQFLLYNLFHVYINLSKYDMGDHLKWRIFGFFSEPNMFSLYYVLAVPLFYAYLNQRFGNRWLLKYFFLALVFAAIFLSFSRGALLAFVWFAFVVFVKNKGRWVNILLVVLLVLTGAAFSIFLSSSIEANESLYRLTSFDILSDPSSSSRLDVFISLYNYFLSYGFGTPYTLLFGNGLSSFRAIAYPFESEFNYFAMNLYVDLLFEHGILVFVAVFGALIRLRRWSKSAESELIRTLSLAVPMFLIICLFYPIRTVLQYQLPFLLTIALLIFYHRKKEAASGSLQTAN